MRWLLVVLGLAMGVAAALYVLFWPSYQIPLGLGVEVKEAEPGKYQVFFQPTYSRYEPSNQPAVIIILPSAREVGVPPMRSVQLSAVGPTVGEVWLNDAEVRGNTVVVRLDGKFGEVLDDWLQYLGNATGTEPSIHIHIWYGDEYLGFAAVNYDPHKLAGKNVTYVVKARVVTAERPIKPKPKQSSGYAFAKFGLDCTYEWRYNYTVIDTEKDAGGKIPIFFLYNQYLYSGEVGLDYEIVIGSRFYVSAALALGYEIGNVGFKLTDLLPGQWDIKDNTTTISGRHSVLPEKAFWAGAYGRLTVDRYDEWQICYDGGRVVGASRTGNVMYKTRVHYLKKDSTGKTVVFREGVDANTLATLLELKNYYKIIKSITAEVSTAQNPKVINLGELFVSHINSQCSQPLSVDAPVGAIALGFVALLKGLQYAKANSWLLAIPLSVDADIKQFAGVEYKARYENIGAALGNGYNVVEYVDLYAISNQVKIDNNCVVDLPIGYVISR
ncbi:hypothetical protein CGL51_05875 [Pyrobaculum aerophilum]|uniref:Uncharacterized protein n=2 Tax=Pyrobaculum aerophilum TaxID=13773 RepID=A0A371QZK8_9CREN|nr:hypothetical protein CGL51_05875 [Pyrobaculum aerophilum]RFA98623.1 hypothetical protein CGL52_06665 [Pyrobaculum aerophilum]